MTYAAKKLNVTYNAIYARVQKSPQLQRTLAEVQESYLDMTEHALIKKIKDEDLGAICFFLKCKGRKRGYVEKPKEENIPEQKAQPVQVVIEVEDARKG